MATFFGQIKDKSVTPAVNDFNTFARTAAMTPEKLMTTPQEKYMFHTAKNLDLADAGIIDRESVPSKSYFDAGQAQTMQQALMMDSLNRDLLAKPFREEVTATGTFNPDKQVMGAIRTDKKGNIFQDYTQRSAEQTDVKDESLGNLTSQFKGYKETPGTKLLKAAPAPRKGGGGTPLKITEASKGYGSTTSYEQDLMDNLSSTLKVEGYGDADNIAQTVASIIKSQGGSIDRVTAKLANVYNQDPVKAKLIEDAIAKLDRNYNQYQNVMIDGQTTDAELTLAEGNEYRFASRINGTIDEISQVRAFKDKSGNLFYELKDQNGDPIYTSHSDTDKMKAKIRDNFKKTGYHINTTGNTEYIKGEVGKVPSVKTFYNPTDHKLTDDMKLYALTNSSNPTFKEAIAKDDATFEKYIKIGEKSAYFSDGEREETLKAMEKDGVKFSIEDRQKWIDSGSKRYEPKVFNAQIDVARTNTMQKKASTFKKNRGDIEQYGNSLNFKAIIQNGPPNGIVAKAVVNATGNKPTVKFNYGNGKLSNEYDVPMDIKPEQLDEYLEKLMIKDLEEVQLKSEEAQAKGIPADSKIAKVFTKQMVKRAKEY